MLFGVPTDTFVFIEVPFLLYLIEISHAPIDVTVVEPSEVSLQDSEEEEGTIYLNEIEEEWDLDKYKGIGWDAE